MKHLKNMAGFTITEVLIAMLITGILSVAAFQFYTKIHGQTIAQGNISDMQQNSRASLQEIVKSLRSAGYKIGAHPAYAINGDSLYVFSNITQPVDTILYYLVPYTVAEYSHVADLPTNLKPNKLMKKINGGTAEIFSDFINDIEFTAVNANTIEIIIKVQPEMSDLDYGGNDGNRIYTSREIVIIRNTLI